MQKINRTILSVLLVTALLLSALIVPAGAVEANETNSNETINPYLLGDADRSGAVDTIDVICIMRWDAGFTRGIVDPDFFLYTGDVDGDGEVGIIDATYIQRWIAGMNVPYRVGEPIQNDPSPEEKVWPLPGYYYLPNDYSEDHKYITVNAAVGTPVLAAESGVVVSVNNSCTHLDTFCACGGGYGNYVWILTDSGIEMIYGYLITAAVKVGDVVTAGDTVGYVGSTGVASNPSLLFECRQDGVKIDPLSIYESDSIEHDC